MTGESLTSKGELMNSSKLDEKHQPLKYKQPLLPGQGKYLLISTDLWLH